MVVTSIQVLSICASDTKILSSGRLEKQVDYHLFCLTRCTVGASRSVGQVGRRIFFSPPYLSR